MDSAAWAAGSASVVGDSVAVDSAEAVVGDSVTVVGEAVMEGSGEMVEVAEVTVKTRNPNIGNRFS